MKIVFSPPKEWQNWLSLGFGLWLILSPWLLHFGDSETASTNAISIGFLIILAEVFTFSTLGAVEELVDFILGLWLLASPWILGLANSAARMNFIVIGLLVLALAIYEFSGTRWRTSS